MTFLRQVRHVVAKDVREARWLLGAYVLLVAGVTVHVSGWVSDSGIAGGFWMLLVVLVGMFAVASVVQADPPLRSNAFWASRPLAPSAMLTAKGVIAAAIVAIGVAGQVAALASYDLPLRELAGDAARSAAVYALLLVCALVFAAVASELRTFTLLLLAVPVLGTAPAALDRVEVSPFMEAMIGIGKPVLGVICAAAFVAWLYQRRDVRRWQRVAGTVAVVLLLFVAPPINPVETVGATPVTTPTLPLGSVRMRLGDEPIGPRGPYVILDVQPASAGHNLWLENQRITIQLHDSSVLRVEPKARTNLVSSGLPVLPGVRWLAVGVRGWTGVQLEVPLSAAQRIAVSRGIQRITLEADLVGSEARVAATIPLRQGAPSATPGRRFLIEELGRDGEHVAIDLATTSLVKSGERDDLPFAANYALVNRSAGTAAALQRGSGHGSSGGLVLPGANVQVYRHELSTRGHFRRPADATIGAGWLSGAELVAIDWVPVGRHRIGLAIEPGDTR